MGVSNPMKLFIWRACHNLLPTRANILKRKVVEDSTCPCCGGEAETVLHALWTCPAAQNVGGGGGRSPALKSAIVSSSVFQFCEAF
jgi:ribosomal protein L37AE/L43A